MSETSNESPGTDAATGNKQGQLSIQKVYIKDASFEAPHAPQIFTEEWKPTVDIQLANQASRLTENSQEVVLTVTVTVSFDDKTVYLVEVQQAGIFQISGVSGQQLKAIVSAVCPNVLFPFAREAIADLVSRGGFPQLLLAPVNFEVLYAQQLQRQKSATTPQPEQTH